MMFWMLILIPIGLVAYLFWPETALPADAKIDRIDVRKSKRLMHVYSNGELLKTYKISLGGNPVGHKQFEGDCKTPEGTYTINDRNPNSGYHKNLGISYPNDADRAFALSQNKPAGGAIKIHGIRNGRGVIGKFHRWRDWTAGCIAVTNGEVDELYSAVAPGAVITIFP